MITVRKAQDRGRSQAYWLESYHSFSFDDYYDLAHTGYRTLRVINQDTVQPNEGFPSHPHQDMEILSYVIAGVLKHKDNQGDEAVIRTGEIQLISAGTGIVHSEYNPSESEPVQFLQIWIHPEQMGLPPSYETRAFAPIVPNSLQLLASRDGRNESATIHQDAAIYLGDLAVGKTIEYSLPEGRYAWLQIISGVLELRGRRLETGDGASVCEERLMSLSTPNQASFMLFDLN